MKKTISIILVVSIIVLLVSGCSANTFTSNSIDGYWIKISGSTADGLYISGDTVKLYALGEPDGTFYESVATSLNVVKQNGTYYLEQGGTIKGTLTREGNSISLSNTGTFDGSYQKTTAFNLK